jgi:pilus retraction protein PilT
VDFGYEIPGWRATGPIISCRRTASGRFSGNSQHDHDRRTAGPAAGDFQAGIAAPGAGHRHGPTGSGKSTTLAAIIDVANRTRSDHIITVEDPIEFVHKSRSCLVNHREVGLHTKSFSAALRGALREDPDIILVGEMRDLETISLAIEAATGHLVFGTLHTTSAPKTVDRIVEVFPAQEQAQIRSTLADGIRAIIAQTLFKRIDKKGRVPALEILIATPAVRNLIRESKTHQLPSMMQTGKKYGMQLLDDAIMDLYNKGGSVRRRCLHQGQRQVPLPAAAEIAANGFHRSLKG